MLTNVETTILKNGLRLLIRRDRSAPVVAIVTYVKAGYFDETDDVAGISHVLEHMYFKGTPTRGTGEIARHTKAAGGYLNAGTIYDHTSYYAVLPSSGFLQGLEVQADAYANSLIDPDELARELEVIIEEAKRKADNPVAVATETLYELMHDRHRMRRWRIGREEGLRALTRDDVVRFYRNFYRPSSTILSIVGDVDPAHALREAERLYGVLEPGEPMRSAGPTENSASGFRVREFAGDIAQAQVAVGWRTPGTLHDDTAALEVLATMLGVGRASRLFRAVRERKLAKGVQSYHYSPTELGVFVVHAEGPADTARDALRAAWAQVAAVRAGDIGDLELERAKRVLESRLVRRLEDMEGQANFLAEWEALGAWTMGPGFADRVLAVSRDEVVEAAQRYLGPDQASVLAYRPSGAEPIAASADEMREVLASPGVEPLAPGAPHRAAPTALLSAKPELLREEAGVRVYRTTAGVPILVRTRADAPLVHAGIFAGGGAAREDASLAGLTALMARVAIKGTARRSAVAIAEESEMLGGSVSASTSSESFGWALSVPARHGVAALELLSDVVQHPVFDQDALDTERAIAIADVRAQRDDMYRYPMRLAVQAAYEGHPYGIPASGTEESLERITRDDVVDWHRRTVGGLAGAIGVVGPGDPDEWAAEAARVFAEVRPGVPDELPPAPWPEAVVVAAEDRDRAQTALALLLPGPARNDPDRFAAAMISGVASGLGGRFFDELRDKQSLCYTVNLATAERRLGGMFGAYIATSPEKEDFARAGLLREFARFVEEPVGGEELLRAQNYTIGTHAIRQQSGGAVLGEMIEAWLHGSLAELAELDERVRAVTVEDVRRVAARYFDPSVRVEGLVRGRNA